MLKYVNIFLFKKMFFKNSVDNKQHNLTEEENWVFFLPVIHFYIFNKFNYLSNDLTQLKFLQNCLYTCYLITPSLRQRLKTWVEVISWL